MAVSIVHLPCEIIEQILLELDPLHIATFAQTNRAYHTLVHHSHDQHFWRELYLRQDFDDPRTCLTPLGSPRTEPVDWRSDLQRIVRARTVATHPTLCSPRERLAALRTLGDLARRAPSAPTVFSDKLSHNLLWLAAILRGGALLDGVPDSKGKGKDESESESKRALARASNGHDDEQNAELDNDVDEDEVQLRARLHTHYGITARDSGQARRVEALAYVYDMRNYRPESDYGPFLPDGSGRVNWVHMQALHHTVAMHSISLDELAEDDFVIHQMSIPYCQSIIPEGMNLDTERDWAGIEGLWHCAFCFIDHRALLLYNQFNHVGDEPLDASFFTNPGFGEIYRVIPVQFRITATQPDPNYPTRPRLLIQGNVRDEITMTGHVSLTPDEQLHWHLISGENGQAIWSMEGVQVGGLRSYFGVLGSWTTIFHEQHDPVGPLWLHKALPNSAEHLS